MDTQNCKHIAATIWQNRAQNQLLQIYAILDAARNEGIYPQLRSHATDTQSLFQGSRAQELALVAPYLINLTPEDHITSWFLQQGWGKSWGIFCESKTDTTRLRRHLQQVFEVYSKECSPLYFRFYDPRVLKVYLRSATAKELEKIFGPIQAFYVEGDEENSLIQYMFSAEKLIERVIRL